MRDIQCGTRLSHSMRLAIMWVSTSTYNSFYIRS